MARKVLYTSKQRATKAARGVVTVCIGYLDADGDVVNAALLGFVVKERGAAECTAVASATFNINPLEEAPIGSFATQARAGEALKKLYDAEHPAQKGRQKKAKVAAVVEDAGEDVVEDAGEDVVEDAGEDAGEDVVEEDARMLPLAEAAAELCGGAKDPVAALRKRIARGKVETFEDGGEVFVVMPAS